MNTEERLEELLLDWEEMKEAGNAPTAEELCRHCPELADELRRRIKCLQGMDWVGKLNREKKTVVLTPGAEPVSGYRLVERIGRGGFGEVWKAAGPSGFAVALKFLPWSHRAASIEARSLQALQGVEHPNVLKILGSWQTDDMLVIGMELADRTLLDWRGVGDGPDLLTLFRQAADGIDHLHSRGIQHRDVKPANLLLKGDVLKVADFGLARVLEHSVSGHSGSLTLAYAPPEFFDGHTAKNSDQYSLAVTYCQLRGGRLPFEGTTAQIVAGHLRKPPDLSMLPERERPVVARALSKRPEKRWPSCRAFVDAIASAHPRPRSASWWLRASLLLGMVAILLAVTFWLYPGKGEGQPNPSQAHPGNRPAFLFDGRSRIVTPLERFSPVSLEAWVRPDSPPGGGRPEKTIIGSDIPGESGISIGMVYHDLHSAPLLGAQILPAPTYRDVSTNAPLPLRQWTHVAAVFGPEKTVVFRNGKPVAQGAGTANEGGTPFVIGNAGELNREHYFVGKISAVRISRGDRYTGQFEPEVTFHPDSQAVLIYDASRIAGSRVIDLSGAGNHGISEGVVIERGGDLPE